MDEIYEPKKGFEDLFADLLEEFKREIQTVSNAIANQDQRSDEMPKDWVARKLADTEAKLEAIAAKYKPWFLALSNKATEFKEK